MNEGHKLNILTWNVRGLNDPHKRCNIRKHIAIHKPHILALPETKLADINLTLLKEIMGKTYDEFLTVNAQGAT
jgi:exonuclease III